MIDVHPALYINGRFLSQPLSGVQRFATEITAALSRICPESGAFSPIILVPPVADDVVKPMWSRTVGRHSGQVWEQLELPRHASDGVLVNLGNTGPIIGGSQLVVIHDAGIFSVPEAYSWKFRLWYRLLQKALVSRKTLIVTVSEFSKSELSGHLNVPESLMRVISEGADHMDRILEDNAVLVRHRLVRGRFVLAVGNLAAHKNLHALNATAQMLAERGMTLAITGGLDHGVFQKSAPLPAPATYVGRVSDGELKALYSAAACFVFPSLYEGFGLPAIEAMACGCAVVAADIPALREACHTAALYADPTNPDDIATRLALMIDNDDLREAMRERARRHSQSFTWAAAAGALAAIAEEIPRRHPRLQSYKVSTHDRVRTAA